MTAGEWIQVGNIVTPVLVGAAAWFMRQTLARVTDRLDRIEQDVGRVDREVQALRTVERDSVSREEFVRETARTRITLERLGEGLARIEGRIDMTARLRCMGPALTGPVGASGPCDETGGPSAD